MYLSQIGKCIFFKLKNIFVSRQLAVLCPDIRHHAVVGKLPEKSSKCICLKLQNVFVLNWKMHVVRDISQFFARTWDMIQWSAGCQRNLPNVFVSSCEIHLFQIAKYIFVSKFKMYFLETSRGSLPVQNDLNSTWEVLFK